MHPRITLPGHGLNDTPTTITVDQISHYGLINPYNALDGTEITLKTGQRVTTSLTAWEVDKAIKKAEEEQEK